MTEDDDIRNVVNDAEEPTDDELTLPPAFSEEALALRFADLHCDRLRYVAKWGRWMKWDGVRWESDDTLFAFDLARKLCREVAAGCNRERERKAITSAKTVAAIERLSKADRRFAATIDQWDVDPWLLNTPEGVVDLRTGNLRSCRPDDYMTRVTAVAPEKMETPVWAAHLRRVMNGHEGLVGYLKRRFGYCLTGVTREHALFFDYGTGRNGKGTTIGTVGSILNDYHRTAPIDTFTASSFERHPTELAGLQGARLVTSSETKEGSRWDETRIKTLTGGDKISARFMRGDFFDFQPQFKLLISGNHKPKLRSVDEAIQARLQLVPYAVTIPPTERDPELVEKLKAEWPGILQWMIEGCLEWLRDGLQPPAEVRETTANYMRSQDTIGAWIEEECELDPGAWTELKKLYASYRDWCETAGERFALNKREFSDALEDRDFLSVKRHAYGRCGLKLKAPDATRDRREKM